MGERGRGEEEEQEQTVEACTCPSRWARFLQLNQKAALAAGAKKASRRLALLQLGVRHTWINEHQCEGTGSVGYPPQTSVRQTLEGSTFSIVVSLEVKPLAQGEGVRRLVPSLRV